MWYASKRAVFTARLLPYLQADRESKQQSLTEYSNAKRVAESESDFKQVCSELQWRAAGEQTEKIKAPDIQNSSQTRR